MGERLKALNTLSGGGSAVYKEYPGGRAVSGLSLKTWGLASKCVMWRFKKCD